MSSVSEVPRALLTQGYVRLPSRLPEDGCRRVEAAFFQAFAGNAAAQRSGELVFREALEICPEAPSVVFSSDVLQAVRAYLGDEIRIEAFAAIVSSPRRGFMAWHAHVGGVDQSRVRRDGEPPRTGPRRVMIMAYPAGCSEGLGPLLVSPRAFDDALEMPHAPKQVEWPSAVEIQAPPGGVVICDEATFHAVRPQTTDRPRLVFGAYMIRADVRSVAGPDPSVLRFRTEDAEIQRLLGS